MRELPPPPVPSERISGWWWLLPFFLTWIGGLIAYIVIKDRNPKTARKMLIFGLVWGFVAVAVYFLFFFLLVWTFGNSFQTFTGQP